MKHKNTTRSALFTSIVSLLLCVSMLVGTTFAWFTDEVKSGVNMIAAGNLDIEVTNADGDSIEELKTLFNDVTLWEPGAVAYEELTISNEGSLALKYAMSFAWEGENNLNGHKLSDVLKVAVLEADVVAGLDMEDRAAVLAAAKAATSGDLKTFSVSGSLYSAENAAAGEYTEREIHVVIYWEPSELDNLYNANNGQKTSDGKPLHIELGVVVKATQQMKEEDSFGDDYDERAEYPENTWLGDATYDWYNNPEGNTYTLTYASDLAGFANIVNGTAPSTMARSGYLPADNFEGKIVKLADSIDLNDLAWTPIGINGNYFAGTFDGDGKTIYNLNVDTAKQSGLFANVRGTLKNVTIWGATIRSNDYAGALLGQGYAYIDNCHAVNVDVIATPVLKGNEYDGGAKVGGLVGQLCEGNLYIKNSSVTNAYVRAYRDVGGLVGMAHYGTTVSGNTVTGATVSFIAAGDYAPYNGNTGNENLSAVVGRIGIKEGRPVTIENNTFTDCSVAMAPDVTSADIKEMIKEAEGDVTIDAGGANIGTLNYGLDTSLVPSGTTVTIKNAVVSGQSYGNAVAGTVIFENCDFNNPDGAYSIHFDAGGGDVVFKNCTLAGWCSYGSAIKSVTMEGCTIKHNGLYGQQRFYQPAIMEDCVVESAVTIDASSNCDLVLNNCTVDDGSYITSVIYVDDCFTSITIDGKETIYTQAAFDAAQKTNATIYLIGNDDEGEYDLKGNQADGLTIIGLGDDVKMVNTTQYASGKTVGAIWQAINLENVTITNTVYTMADGGNATFTNVNFAAGVRRAYGKNVVFTDCTFGSNSEDYALHFESDSASEDGEIKLNGCEFEGGKVHLGSKRAYAFTGCDFAAGTDFQVWSNITLEGCTVDGVVITAENIATFFPNLNLEKVTIK